MIDMLFCLVTIEKNLNVGAAQCKYAVVIISKYTLDSKCAMEEIDIIQKRYRGGDITIFPILFEISSDKIDRKIDWIKELIFKEVVFFSTQLLFRKSLHNAILPVFVYSFLLYAVVLIFLHSAA